MAQNDYWKSRFKNWVKKSGLDDDPSAFEVFKTLMEARDRDSRALVTDLQERFRNIEVILQETHGERKNQ